MGKVEKVIVLSVLFLIALILGVSLMWEPPLDKSRLAEAGATERKAAVSPSELAKANGAPANPFLSATVTTPDAGANAPAANAVVPPAAVNEAAPVAAPNTAVVPPAATPAAAPNAAVATPTGAAVPMLPAGALLKRLDGLEDSLLPDMKLYTWKEGDDLNKVAQHYYGDRNKFTVLRRSNEGHTTIQPGQKIFVPVFDASGPSLVRETADASGAKKAEKGAAKAVVADAGKKVHVVKDGESLWKIAKLELGDGNRWKEIYELNRDVLAKPESVHKGMRLRIP